jgi:hypothetical protein
MIGHDDARGSHVKGLDTDQRDYLGAYAPTEYIVLVEVSVEKLRRMAK